MGRNMNWGRKALNWDNSQSNGGKAVTAHDDVYFPKRKKFKRTGIVERERTLRELELLVAYQRDPKNPKI